MTPTPIPKPILKPKSQPVCHAQVGFTLVEVLVALTIFAFLAVAAWQVFGQLELTRERTSVQAERLGALQMAYRQMQQDFLQVSSRAVVVDDVKQPAFELATSRMSFSKTTAPDPRMAVSTPLERIGYALSDSALQRTSQKDMTNKAAKPLVSTLLKDVEGLKFTALDPGAAPLWPPLDDLVPIPQADKGVRSQVSERLTKLPLGVSVSFVYAGNEVSWRFLLPPSAPKIAQKKPEQDKGKADGAGGSQQPNSESGKSGNQEHVEPDDDREA